MDVELHGGLVPLILVLLKGEVYLFSLWNMPSSVALVPGRILSLLLVKSFDALLKF